MHSVAQLLDCSIVAFIGNAPACTALWEGCSRVSSICYSSQSVGKTCAQVDKRPQTAAMSAVVLSVALVVLHI
jgi:hypothetical protein